MGTASIGVRPRLFLQSVSTAWQINISGGDKTLSGTLANTGLVAVAGGVLTLAGGGTHTGTFSEQVSAAVAVEVSQDRIFLDI